jgi:hypothetical protein
MEKKPHQSDKEVMELTIEFELIVPDMEFYSCWLVTFVICYW